MSGLFGGMKVPKPPPIPDQNDAAAAADKLREQLASRSGRQQTLLTQTVDTGAGRQRPRAASLAG